MLDLNNHFLIAMPSMADDDFAKSVVFIFDYGEKGAAGLVINKPSDTSIKHMFDRMDMPLRREDLHALPVFNGGPMYTDRGFVLHEAESAFEVKTGGQASQSEASFYASTLSLPGGLEMTTSRDVLEALSSGAGPHDVFMSLGYASWQAGQLEQELSRNDWLTVPANPAIIFDVPVAERYSAALALLGIDEIQLHSVGGSA